MEIDSNTTASPLRNISQLDITPQESISNYTSKNKGKNISSFTMKKKFGKGNHTKKSRQRKGSEIAQVNSYFFCECSICKQQIKKGSYLEVKKQINYKIYQGNLISFSKLIEYMLPPNEKIKGCQVLFPDTVFFANGKPQFIARNDKEGCLMLIQQQSKLALQDIRQKFSQIVRDRKKETQLIQFQQQTGRGDNKHERSQSFHKRNQSEDKQGDEKSIYYKDTAVIRYNDEDESAKVVRDTEFINEFKRRANDDFWRTITCIQTIVKAKTGIGHPIFYDFYAPINEQKPSNDINYDAFKEMQDDYDLQKQGLEDNYVYKQCLKISYYIQKVYNKEILQMKTLFLKDENGNIWFFYAKNIQIRQLKSKTNPNFHVKAQNSVNQSQDQILNDIQRFESEANIQQNQTMSRMVNVMDSYYSSMKEGTGLGELQKHEEDDYKLNERVHEQYLKLKKKQTMEKYVEESVFY